MRFIKTIKVYSPETLFLIAGSVGGAFAQENEKANEIGLPLTLVVAGDGFAGALTAHPG